MRELIKQNFRPQDYFEIHSKMVGTGMIGGKACGMLLARKIVENHRPDIFERLEPHDSFYIGSDVFYTYIVDNGFWDIKIRQKTEEGYFALADAFSERIMQGSFNPELGVPSSFSDISEFNAIFEVSEKRAGYMPELSMEAISFRIWLKRASFIPPSSRAAVPFIFAPICCQQAKTHFLITLILRRSLKQLCS